MLAARGLVEAVTWSFISEAQAALFGGGAPALKLANPISADMSDMRPSLIPALRPPPSATPTAARGRGAVRGGAGVRRRPAKDQTTAATVVRRGTAGEGGAGRHWSGKADAVSVYDAKADALALLEALGFDTSKAQIGPGAPGWYHPGRSGVIKLGPKVTIGAFGELHPAVLQALDVAGPIVACEITLDAIPEPKAKASKAKPALAISDLMPVSRDFAFVVDDAVEAAKIVKAAEGADRKLIGGVSVFDVYRGEHVGAGRKSIAIEVTLTPTERTLTDEDIETVSKRSSAPWRRRPARACAAEVRSDAIQRSGGRNRRSAPAVAPSDLTAKETTMDGAADGYNILWFVATVIGTVVLGAVIAYGIMRGRSRTTRERIAGEMRTREIYKSEDPGYEKR